MLICTKYRYKGTSSFRFVTTLSFQTTPSVPTIPVAKLETENEPYIHVQWPTIGSLFYLTNIVSHIRPLF